MHGYKIRKKRLPTGYWQHSYVSDSEFEIGERIPVRRFRSKNDFMEDMTKRWNTKYSNICVATLEDRYKN